MASEDLDFHQSIPSVTGPYGLNFGIEFSDSHPYRIEAALPVLTSTIQFAAGVPYLVNGFIADLNSSFVFDYDINVIRYDIEPELIAAWEACALLSTRTTLSFQFLTESFQQHLPIAFAVNQALVSPDIIMPWKLLDAFTFYLLAKYGYPPGVQSDSRFVWQRLTPATRSFALLCDYPTYVTSCYSVVWNYNPLTDLTAIFKLNKGNLARISSAFVFNLPDNAAIEPHFFIRWGLGRNLVNDYHPPVVIPPPFVPIAFFNPVDLDFFEKKYGLYSPVDLNFGIFTKTLIIPVRSVYFMANSVELVKLPERTPIECFGANLSFDAGSWGWQVQAAVAPDAWLLLYPSPHDPIEIEITINGAETFIAIIKHISRSRKFGEQAISITAVSRAAWLAAPLAPVSTRLNTSAMTAQQLMNASLLVAPYAGSTGFSLNWGLTDWLVPANAYSYTGSTMDYLNDIAGAVGAYVYAHRSAWQLYVKPFFPAPAWLWPESVPDIAVPIDAIVTDSLQWDDLPDINAVVMTGGSIGGIIDMAKRQGTAGDKTRLPINHSLFTHVDATRQRAIQELSQTCRRIRSTITMPIYPETGVIDSGKLIRITEGGQQTTWISRSINVHASVSEVNQSVELERYEYLD